MGDCTASELLRQLIHLNARTAARHVLICPAGEHIRCAKCDGWFSHPRGLFAQASRIAVSAAVPNSMAAHISYMSDKGWHQRTEFLNTSAYPNLFATAWPSAVHWMPALPHPPWARIRNKRDSLMSFVGSDIHGDVLVRKKITHTCRRYNDSRICLLTAPSSVDTIAAAKSKSTFCLEPAGDTPFRKSIIDSIVLGCIPVLFNNISDLSAEVWRPWQTKSRILIAREEFLANRVHLRSLLSSVPPQKVREMQRMLQSWGGQLQISLHDDPHDGIAMLLRRVVQIASL